MELLFSLTKNKQLSLHRELRHNYKRWKASGGCQSFIQKFKNKVNKIKVNKWLTNKKVNKLKSSLSVFSWTKISNS